MKQGGNRDKQRSVRDEMEIEWGGEWRCSREGVEQNRLCQRSIGNQVSNKTPTRVILQIKAMHPEPRQT